MSLFTPFFGLYAPNAHPTFPWWHKESNGWHIRWVRADGTWQVQVNSHTSGEILVKRLDLGELDEETQRLRSARGFHPFGGNIPMTARGALIERVNLTVSSSGATDTTDTQSKG